MKVIPEMRRVNIISTFVFTDISVEIISEDGSKMSNAKHSSLSMKLWKVDNRSKNAPASRVNI